jgi:hypothetical protein
MPNDRCIKHRKEIIGVCNWCGARLCQLCVADKNGNKLYCEKCVGQLSIVKRVKIPPAASAPANRKDDDAPPSVEPYY